MIIYFVRHGTTAGNDANQFQLPTIELSEKGRREAEFMAKRFESIPIDVVLSSTMTRAAQTAHIIAERTGHEIIENPIFEEIKRPSSVRGRSKDDEDVKSIMKEVKANFENPDWRHSDEENYYLLKERAVEALALLTARPEERILVVTHGEILKMMLSVIVFGDSLKPEIYDCVRTKFGTFNTGISKVDYNDLGWYLLAWNDHAHLGEVR